MNVGIDVLQGQGTDEVVSSGRGLVVQFECHVAPCDMTPDTVRRTRVVASDMATHGEGISVVVNCLGQLILSKGLPSSEEINGLEHARLTRGVIPHDAVDAG